MATDMIERAIEFEVETAERRADLREANEVNFTMAENGRNPNGVNTDGAMDVDAQQTTSPATFTPGAKTDSAVSAPLITGLNGQNHVTQNSEAANGFQMPTTNANDEVDSLKLTEEQHAAPKIVTLADAILDEVKLSSTVRDLRSQAESELTHI